MDIMHEGTWRVGRVIESKCLVSTAPHKTSKTRVAKEAPKCQGAPIWLLQDLRVKELNLVTWQNRMNFASTNLKKRCYHVKFMDMDGIDFLFLGESIKHVGWVRKAQERQAPRVQHAMVVNMYDGITKRGGYQMPSCGWLEQAQQHVLEQESPI